MAEYIEREALLKILTFEDGRRIPEVDVDNFPTTVTIRDVKKLIRDIPAEDVAPVVHGRWEWYEEQHGTPIDGHDYDWGWRCSHCKSDLPDNYDDPDYPPQLSYCPSCGAKMQEDDRTAKRKPHRLNGVENARKV